MDSSSSEPHQYLLLCSYHALGLRDPNGDPACSISLQVEIQEGGVTLVSLDASKVATLRGSTITRAPDGEPVVLRGSGLRREEGLERVIGEERGLLLT